MDRLVTFAITAALKQDWVKAVTINQEILEETQDDIDTLNRLGNAYIHTGKIDKAKQVYRKILILDKYNIIAQKNLDKLKSLPKSAKRTINSTSKSSILSPSLFIEEPGRTKTVILTHVAPANILSAISVGETVYINPKKHSIEIRTENKTHLGALPDDIAFRMLKFVKAGNQYHVCIKNTTKNSISVFIKETKRGKRLAMQPTFFVSSASETHTIHREIKLVPDEEASEEKNKNSQDEFEEE